MNEFELQIQQAFLILIICKIYWKIKHGLDNRNNELQKCYEVNELFKELIYGTKFSKGVHIIFFQLNINNLIDEAWLSL